MFINPIPARVHSLGKTFALFVLAFTCFQSVSFSQTVEQAKTFHVNGTVTATNNGISLIPSFSLGRPAAFFDFSVGGERLSFDPMFRFGMDGKPWTFVLWGRYKVIKDKRFTLSVGAHPAFMFRDMTVLVDGKPATMMGTQRFIAGEILPMYKVNNHFSVGIYYLQGHGLNPIPPKSSKFLALNTVFSNLALSKEISLRMNPQVYFLSVDGVTGTYVTSSFTVTKKDFPIGFQTLFNQKIKSDVAGDNLVWNLSLLYNFSTNFSKK